jgi:hypothetical protein
VLDHDPVEPAPQRVHLAVHVLGIEAFAHRGETADVREQDRGLPSSLGGGTTARALAQDGEGSLRDRSRRDGVSGFERADGRAQRGAIGGDRTGGAGPAEAQAATAAAGRVPTAAGPASGIGIVQDPSASRTARTSRTTIFFTTSSLPRNHHDTTALRADQAPAAQTAEKSSVAK